MLSSRSPPSESPAAEGVWKTLIQLITPYTAACGGVRSTPIPVATVASAVCSLGALRTLRDNHGGRRRLKDADSPNNPVRRSMRRRPGPAQHAADGVRSTPILVATGVDAMCLGALRTLRDNPGGNGRLKDADSLSSPVRRSYA